MKMSKKELAKRYFLFLISLFISALGVAITKRGELGVSPISSVANVLSLKYPVLTMGNWLIIWNCVLILGQIVILRKDFRWIQLLQVPLSFLFGYFTDFGMWLMSFVSAEIYAVRLAMVFVGTAVLGLGISLAVVANVIMNSGEAFVKAVSDKSKIEFGTVKIGFDISCVVLSVVLSLIFFEFTIKGAREGTLIAAVLTGVAVKLWLRVVRKPAGKYLAGRIMS